MSYPSSRGFCGQSRQPKDVVLLLKAEEEEGLVLNDRPAYGKAVVLIAQFGGFGKLGRRRKERRSCRVVLVAVVIVGAAVRVVCPTLDDQVDGSASIASSLGIGLGLGGEFVNRINRHHSAGDSGNTALIDRRNIVPEVIVIGAVNLPVHLVGTRSVQRTETANRVAAIAGCNRNQLGKITPVQGYFLHGGVGKSVSLRRRCRVHDQCCRRDLDNSCAR